MSVEHDPSKDVERAYFANIGAAGMEHALRKPFADETADRLLMEIGAVMALLPKPPAAVADLGCGAGWTSSFLARRGYTVVGFDLSPEAIEAARASHRLPNLSFEVLDFDSAWSGQACFDAAVFFDALHHAPDEGVALRTAYAMLKPGGTLVACEPGAGHAASPTSREAVARFGVRERDMPPAAILAAARRAGFRAARTYPHPHELHRHAYLPRERTGLRQRLLASSPGLALRLLRSVFAIRQRWGLVVLRK